MESKSEGIDVGLFIDTRAASLGFTVEEVVAAVAQMRVVDWPLTEKNLEYMLWQERAHQALDKARQALEPVIEAFNEFVAKLTAAAQHIVDAVVAALNTFMVKAAWLTGVNLSDWWTAYAAFCRGRMRQKVDRWRLLKRPAGWLVDRLPDRAIVFLFREVYLR